MSNQGTPEIFCDVLEVFERENVRYVVVGGVAVVLHGYLRAVADLDVVIDSAADNTHRTLDALTGAGFVASIPLPLNMLTMVRMFDRSAREVDVFVRFQIPFEELWSCSSLVRVCEQSIRIASLEHLLKANRLSGRPHDEDIEGLLTHRQEGF
jgi:hypothetical protein